MNGTDQGQKGAPAQAVKNAEGREKQTVWTRYSVVFLTALFCCVLWGSASPAIKIAYELFHIDPGDTASRIMLAGARFMIAGGLTIVLGSLLERRFLHPAKNSWRCVGVLALFQTVGQYFFFFIVFY